MARKEDTPRNKWKNGVSDERKPDPEYDENQDEDEHSDTCYDEIPVFYEDVVILF